MMASDSQPQRSGKTFDNIFLGGRNGSQILGKLKMAEPGIGFQEAISKKVLTMSGSELRQASWCRCSREFQLRIELKNGTVYKFDGFQRDTFDMVADILSSFYGITLEAKETSLRGYNWGKTEFQGQYMNFSVQNKTCFEIPLTDVANTTTAGKNDVAIEFVPADTDKDKKIRIKEDALVEIQFYIPGMAIQSQVDDRKLLKDKDVMMKGKEEGEIPDEDEELVLGDDGEAMTAAAIFCETIKNRADVSASQGDSIVSFEDLLCLTPRGRYEMDMFATFFRIRGKSHDYRILYTSIKHLFLLPKPDDLHHTFVIHLDPPLRQGQTRYPFLVFQFDRDEEIDATIKLDEETIEKQYEGRLRKEYDGPTFMIVSEVFKGLTNLKVTSPGTSYQSAQAHSGIKCSLKANEAFLYPLEKCFISMPKPTTFIPLSDVSLVTFSRVNSAASSTTKTFEMKISTDSAEYTYSSIAREEYANLESFCRVKKLRVTNDFADDGAAYTDDNLDEDDDDEEDSGKRKRNNMSMAERGDDDDSESEDEDFVDKGSDSDVDLEYDTDASSDSGSGSDSDSGSGSGSGSGGSDDESKPKKTKKVKEPKPEKKKKRQKGSDNDSDDDKMESGSSKKKRAKKEKDPNAPKGPKSAFIIFSNEKRNELKEEDSTLSMVDISKKLGVLWKEMGADEKKKYEDMAAEDKERYQNEMSVYGKKSSPVKTSKSSDKVKEDSKVKSSEFIDSDEE